MRPTLSGFLGADIVGAAMVLIAVAAAWSGAGQVVFQFDDWGVIVDNPAVHGWEAWWRSMPGIRPLLKASYVASWLSGAGAAPSFVVFNAAVHAANALLLLALMRTLAPRLALAPRAERWAPSAIALIFALHPAQTEAVTYACGRSVSLMAFFCLGAAVLHARARDSRFPVAARMLSLLAFAAALATKEHAWALPVALLSIEWLDPGTSWARTIRRTLPHWGLLAVLAALALALPDYARLLQGSLTIRSTWTNLLTQVDGVWYLLTRPLFGLILNGDPDLTVRERWSAGLALRAAALALLVAAALYAWRRRPWLGFGVAWLIVWLLPTNSVLPRADIANDRQLYLALAGPALILTSALLTYAPSRLAGAATGAVALWLLWATVERNLDYRGEIVFWEATATRSPDKARVWNNLGWAYQGAGRADAARAAYDRAISLDPGDWRARANRDALGDGSPAP
jgi:hypothetical protein